MNSMIRTNCTDWSTEEITAALPIIAKLTHCFKQVRPEDRPLPRQLYEAWAGATKPVSMEIALFRGKEIYLIQRPSAEEDPHEPWPSQLHLPGATLVPYETSGQAWERLIRKELGNVKMRDLKLVGPRDYMAPPRGVVTTLVHRAETEDDPSNDGGDFYPLDWALASDAVVSFHRDDLIPFALGPDPV